MKIQLRQQLNSCGPATLISYNPENMVGKKPEYKQELPKFEIKNQPDEVNSEEILLCVWVLKKGSYEALFRLLSLIKNIIQDQSLNTGP